MKDTRSITEKKKKLPALVHSRHHDSLRLGVLEASQPGEDQSGAPRRAFGLIRPFDAWIAQQFNRACRRPARAKLVDSSNFCLFLKGAAEQRRGGRGSVEFPKNKPPPPPVPQIRAAALERNLFLIRKRLRRRPFS